MMLNRPRRRISRIVADPLVGILGLVAVAAVVMVFVEPSFVSIANITNVIGAMIAIGFLAIGMTVVLICRGLDLSVGAVMALSAGVAAALLNNGLPMPVAFAAALGVGTAVGCLNGLLVTKLAVPDFIATLAVGSIATGFLLYWTRGVPILGYMSPAYEYVGGLRRLIGPVTLPMLLLAGLAVITALVLRRTTLGIRLYAVGSSPAGALNAGLRVDRLKIYAYMFSGCVAAVAGIYLAGRTTTVPPSMGVGYEISAIAAAVIGGASLLGGRGRVVGALVGALLLTLTRNIINLTGVESSWQTVVTGAVLIGALLANHSWRDLVAHLRRPLRVLSHAEVRPPSIRQGS